MKADNDTKYSLVYAEWEDRKSRTSMKLHDITHQDLLKQAAGMGYRKPKWFQFWRRSIQITGFIDGV